MNRGLFAMLPADTASVMLSALDKGELASIGGISERENCRSRGTETVLKSLQLQNDVAQEGNRWIWDLLPSEAGRQWYVKRLQTKTVLTRG